MKLPDNLRARMRPALVGIGLVAVALLIAVVKLGGDAVGEGGSVLLLPFLLAPTMLVAGLVIAARGLIFNAPALSRRNVLYTGLLMLLLGACPWVYTDLLIGDRPGNEGAGMLGMLLFLFVGVPGLGVLAFGLAAVVRERIG